MVSFSVIDHFFVTEQFLDKCVDASPIHLGDNKSNHSPIILKIDLPQVENINIVRKSSKTVPSWNNISEEDVINFGDILKGKLSRTPLPESLSCSNVMCQESGFKSLKR